MAQMVLAEKYKHNQPLYLLVDPDSFQFQSHDVLLHYKNKIKLNFQGHKYVVFVFRLFLFLPQ